MKKQHTFYLSKDIIKNIRKIAKKNKISLSNLIENILSAYLLENKQFKFNFYNKWE